MRRIPRIVVGGVNSGVGKSSLTLALVAAYRRRGLKVQTFKVGPDYLDPTHLERASGRPCYNLDGWMAGEEYVRSLFERVTADADLCVVEGVMGLFDGSSAKGIEGSTAQVALWLDAPVLLVVNAHGMARSIAPLVRGFSRFEEGLRIAGVVANMCGSAGHGRWLSEALEAAGEPPLLGAVPRGAFPEISSRHLGLLPAAETGWSGETEDRLAHAAEEHIRLDALLEQVRDGAPAAGPSGSPRATGEGIRLGVARDAAFQFYYPDLFDLLRDRGCEIVPFSPVKDPSLPERLDALYLGGGYPENYAKALSRNRSMIAAVREFCASGRPLYAECGGLMYLCSGIELPGAERHELAGILPVWSRMLEKRKALGYVEATLERDSLFGRRGDSFRGHEFHYSELTGSPVGIDGWEGVYALRRNRTGEVRAEGYSRGNVLASYAHLHLASKPGGIDHFIALCKGNR